MKIWLIGIVSLVCCLPIYASEESGEESETANETVSMADRAKNMFGGLEGRFNTTSALQNNMTEPLTGTGASMSTLSGTGAFSAQVGCKSSNTYLSVATGINNDGSITAVASIDSDLDGAIDSDTTFANIDIICANGFQQCTSGIDNCTAYKWRSTPNITAALLSTEQQKEELYSCFCVNNDCGSNLALNNMDEVIRSVGNGIANVMQKHNPYYTISDVNFSGTTLDYLGQDHVSCKQTSIPQVQNFKENNEAFLLAGATAKSDEKYLMIEDVNNRAGKAQTRQVCNISREFSHTTAEDGDVIWLTSGTGNLTSCGENCLELEVGTNSANAYDVGSICRSRIATTYLDIRMPSRIVSATLVQSSFEETMMLESSTNGLMANYNDYTGGSDCQGFTNNRASFSANIDVTEHFQQQGLMSLTARTASYRAGNYYYKIRFRVKAERSKSARFSMFSQGRRYLECEYNFATGNASCTHDGTRQTHEFSNTISVDDYCQPGSNISLQTDFDYWPSIATGRKDTSIRINHIQRPSCDNGLVGKIRLEDDNQSSSDPQYALVQNVDIVVTTPGCELQETINDTCESIPENCTLEKEVVDSIVTIDQMFPTGLNPIPFAKWINDSQCSTQVTRDFYFKTRTYQCADPDPEVTTVDISHFTKPTVSGGNMTIQMSTSGSSTVSNRTLALPELPQNPECIQTCEVRRAKVDNRINEDGLASDGRTDQIMYENIYRDCESGTCPLDSGDELVQSCGCLNEFTKVMSMMQMMRLAGKDMVCVESE